MDMEGSITKAPRVVHISNNRSNDASGSSTTRAPDKTRNPSPHIRIVDAKGPGKQSSRRYESSLSDQSSSDDGDLGSDRRPARRGSRRYSIPNHWGPVDTPYYTGASHYRDSGYYSSTSMSAYPSKYSWDNHYYGYPAYAGPGHMVPAQISSNRPPHIPHHADRTPALTAQEGTVVLRKTRLPGSEDKADSPLNSSLNDIDAVWNVSSTRDVTLHLELDVEDDIDANLDEFSRFTRRGDYKRAEQYYQDNLSRHSEQPRVIVEYVRMLVGKGSYKAINDLGIDEAHIAAVARSRISPHAADAVQLLLLLHMARIRTDADFNAASMAATTALEYLAEDENRQALNHAQIQVMSLYAELFQSITSQSEIGLGPLPGLHLSLEFSFLDGLKNAYEKLLAEGNTWEIRDLIGSGIKLFGSRDTFRAIFPATSTEDALHRLVAEWRMAESNGASDLSLLDLLNTTVGEIQGSRIADPFAPSDGSRIWQTASNLARAVASSIRGSGPALMKSRSYLEWLLIEERRDRTSAQDLDVKFLTAQAVKSFPGKALDLRDTFVYVPKNSENPGWPVSYPNRSNDQSRTPQLILAALKAARELGSYKIEARCLHELVCRAEKPEEYLAELEHIFTSVNGDRLALFKTRLMRYLTVADSDDTTRQKLKSQLVELDPKVQSVWCHFSATPWEWAYRRILFALMAALGEGDTEQAAVMDQQAQALAFRLPPWVSMDDRAKSSYMEALAREQSNAFHHARQHQPRAYQPPPPPPPTEAPRVPTGSPYDFSPTVADQHTPRIRRSMSRRAEIDEERGIPRRASEGYERMETIGARERAPIVIRRRSPSVVRERSPEKVMTERRKSMRFDDEARPSRSMERLRPESKDVRPTDAPALKKASSQELAEERRNQNEEIKRRAEFEKQREREEEIRRTQEEVARMYEEKRRMAELRKLEQEKLRHDMEKEIRMKLAMEEKARAEQRAMEEEMRARAAAEIRAKILLEEEAKAAARAREDLLVQQAKDEAKREFEMQRRAKKEATAAKRLAKVTREAREAAIYSEAEASAKRMLLAELKARVPGKKLRAVLGILEDGEDSDADKRLIEEVHHSDSSSSAGPQTRRPRRYSSSSSSGTESLEERRARARERKGLAEERRARIAALRKESGLNLDPTTSGARSRSQVSSDTESDADEDRQRPRKDNDDEESSDGNLVDGPEIPIRVTSSDEEDGQEASSETAKGKRKEVAQEEPERVETVFDYLEQDEDEPPAQPEPGEPTTTAGQVAPSSSSSSPLPTSPQQPDSPSTSAKAKDSDKRAKVADESEEEAQEHGITNTMKTATATDVQKSKQGSGDDVLVSGGPGATMDMRDDHDDIYD